MLENANMLIRSTNPLGKLCLFGDLDIILIFLNTCACFS